MSSTLAWIVACFLAQAPVADAPGVMAGLPPLEVRIRKLHLVRPDLLQFPIPYDTVC